MKVIHLLKTSKGAAWAFKMLREQLQEGLEVHVVLPSREGRAEDYAKIGCVVHVLNLDFQVVKLWKNIEKERSFKRLLDEVKPDLVHSHFVSTTLVMRLAMRKLNVPKIFQVPGPLHLEHVFYRTIEIFLANKHDYWIGSCEWTVERYAKSGIDRNRLFLSYYGTDVDNFVANNPIDLKAQLSLPQETQLIGMVAYMYAPKKYLGQSRGLKGHEDLVDAVAILKDKYPNLKLLFIGGQWGEASDYFEQVSQYSKEKMGDDAILLGNRSDVLDLYHNLTMAVFPSHSENVGGAVESLLMNVPTITSDVGGFPDLIKHNKTGLLVPSKSPLMLSKAIKFYLDNEQARLTHASTGYKSAHEMFNVKSTTRQVICIYNKILNLK